MITKTGASTKTARTPGAHHHRRCTALLLLLLHIISLTLYSFCKHNVDTHQTIESESNNYSLKVPARKPKHSPSHVYWCGFRNLFDQLDFNIGNHLFPESNVSELQPGFDVPSITDSESVLLYPCGGPCPFEHRENVSHQFKGKILTFNGESTRCIPDQSNVYTVSAGDASNAGATTTSSRAVRVFALAMHLPTLATEWQNRIFRHEHRPVGTGERFLIYATSSCITFREQAFNALSHLGIVEYGGPCHGQWVGRKKQHAAQNVTNVITAPNHVRASNWVQNHKHFESYRFVLAMENQAAKGYLTEKILNAFFAGSVPIYYGTTEVFDVFNGKAFIWYDISNPQLALKRITYLEANRSAYENMLREPILANGSETIQRYFSWYDELGNGAIKWKVREMLGYD